MIKLCGTTIRETLDAFAPVDKQAHLGEGKEGENTAKSADRAKAIVRIVVTAVFLFVGTYWVLATEGQTQQVGSALLGVVGGYWFN